LTGANGSCAVNGTISFNINVSNVGTLNSTNSISGIQFKFSDCDGSGSNLNAIDIFLKAPNGNCTQIYTGGFSTDEDETIEFILVSNSGCLNVPNTTNLPQETGQSLASSGSSGTFAATNSSGAPIDLTTIFNGVNANGNWTIIFSESTSFEPCIEKIELSFGDPTVDALSGNGNQCSNPIIWDGSPICASTNGLTTSSQMPGWAGPGTTSFGTFNGGITCNWNSANNNDLWIKFTAQQSNVCINLSGLDNNQQSVVVSDSNIDGDGNPCTGFGGGQYWNLVSCPNPSIYTTAAGTTQNQNHCFNATIGQAYYLVVDGFGGLESPFYLSGVSGMIYTLPIELRSFDAMLKDKITYITWQTASERNNDFFIIERSHDGIVWEFQEKVKGAGSSNELLSYMTYDFHPHRGIIYYRLKQVDYDGNSTYSEIRSVYNTYELMILPNPSKGIFGVGGMNKHQENMIIVQDISGKVLEQHKTEEESYQLDLTQRSAGVYFLMINGTESIKVIKE
jgi:hypothetical protein